jgi:methyltransferase (TIGR00027 family)
MIEMQGQTNPQKGTDATKIREMTDNLLEKTLPGSKTAAIVAGHRFDESQKPEGERICYDPYAVHFISPEVLELSKHPERAKAMLESLGDIGILLQAMSNSVRARVRYFDDFVKASLDRGLEQLVILGAGYDTRAHRIEGLNGNGCIKVFEADHPATQAMKIDKVKEIFGSLPDHVVYVPVDLATEDLGRKLLENGYDRSLKTLFIMEGLLMYLLPETVRLGAVLHLKELRQGKQHNLRLLSAIRRRWKLKSRPGENSPRLSGTDWRVAEVWNRGWDGRDLPGKERLFSKFAM